MKISSEEAPVDHQDSKYVFNELLLPLKSYQRFVKWTIMSHDKAFRFL